MLGSGTKAPWTPALPRVMVVRLNSKSSETLPDATMLLGSRVAAIAIALPILVSSPPSRLLVNTVVVSSIAVTVPVLNMKQLAPVTQSVEGGSVNVPVVMLMVLKSPVIEASIVLPFAIRPLNVPLSNIPVEQIDAAC